MTGFVGPGGSVSVRRRVRRIRRGDVDSPPGLPVSAPTSAVSGDRRRRQGWISGGARCGAAVRILSGHGGHDGGHDVLVRCGQVQPYPDRIATERRRLTVQQAAEALGMSAEAVRQRVKRNTIPHDPGAGAGSTLGSARSARDGRGAFGGSEPRTVAGGAQKGVQRPWWRRVLEGDW